MASEDTMLPGVCSISGSRWRQNSLEEPLLAGRTPNNVFSSVRQPAVQEQDRWAAQHHKLLEQIAGTWNGKDFREVVRDIWSTGLHHDLFDGSLSRTQRLYHAVVEGQTNLAGSISLAMPRMNFDAFDVALRAERFTLKNYDVGRQLFATLTENTGEMDEMTFHVVLQRLKLQVLNDLAADPRCAHTSKGWCVDWSPSTFTRDVLSQKNMQQHVMNQRSGRCPNRWCHFDQPDDLTVICMGVKYQLQSDALDIFRSARLEGRVWRRGGDVNLLLPISRLTEASFKKYVDFKNHCRTASRDDIRKRATEDRMVVEVEQAHLCLFLSESHDTMFTAIGPWSTSISSIRVPSASDAKPSLLPRLNSGMEEEDDEAPMVASKTGDLGVRRVISKVKEKARVLTAVPGKSRRRMSQDIDWLTSRSGRQAAEVFQGEFDAAVSSSGTLFAETVQALSVDYSELRIGDVSRLFVRLVKGLLLQYRTIHKAFFLRLNWYEENLDEDAGHEIIEMQKEIEVIIWKLDQIAEVISRLVDYKFCEPEVNGYLNFAVDDAKALSSRMSRANELCLRLRDQVVLQQQVKENRTVISITVLVTLMWPLQFLTGVYGMNFQDDNGKGTVPFLGDLTLENSYYMFWGLGLGMIAMLASYFKLAGIL